MKINVELYRVVQENCRELVCTQCLAALNIHLGRISGICKNAMSEVFHNLSMQALRRSIDAVLIKCEAITELAKNINYLIHTKILEFKKQNLKINEESNNKINSSY